MTKPISFSHVEISVSPSSSKCLRYPLIGFGLGTITVIEVALWIDGIIAEFVQSCTQGHL